MFNYYHRHLPNLAHILELLQKLFCKNSKWDWGTEQKQSFEKIKEILCSPKLLIYYNPKKPLLLACGMSPYGLGAVLSHTSSDRSEKPIAYSSSTLLSSGKNYFQTEKKT